MVRDPRIQSVLGAVAALTALGWALMIATGPVSLAAICSAMVDGRVAPTMLMWAVMGATMMLPCAAWQIAGASWEARERNAFGAAAGFAMGFMLVVLAAAAIGGLASLGLEGRGLLDAEGRVTEPLLRAGLLAAAGLLEISKIGRPSPQPCRGENALRNGLAHGRSRMDLLAAMICLQLVGGMDMLWAAMLALWMLAGSILPSPRLSAALGGALMVAAAGAMLAF